MIILMGKLYLNGNHHFWSIINKRISEDQNEAGFLAQLWEKLQLVMLVEELLGLEEWEDSGEDDKPAKGGRERERGLRRDGETLWGLMVA